MKHGRNQTHRPPPRARTTADTDNARKAEPGSHEWLTEKYGDAFFLGEKDQITKISHLYWAGAFAAANNILFEPDEGTFWEYDETTGIYTARSEENFKVRIGELILKKAGEWNKYGLQKHRTDTNLQAVINLLRGIIEKKGAFIRDGRTLAVGNGICRWNPIQKDFDFLPHSPLFYLRNKSPINYHKSAGCPRFLDCLLRPVLSSDDISLFQLLAGSFLLGTNLTQKILILDGPGELGKSCAALIVSGIVGPENTTQLRTQLLTERFEVFRYLRKTVLLGVDVPGNFLEQRGASELKSLTGGDRLDAEGKHTNSNFQRLGDFNILITSNSKLLVRLDGDQSAWSRRLVILPFVGEPPKKRINNFHELLLAEEGPGILGWHLAGIKRLLVELESNGGRVPMTREQTARTHSLIHQSDSLRLFLEQGLIEEAGSSVTVDALATSYATWCKTRNWPAWPRSRIERELPDAVFDTYGISKSNDLKGASGKAVRGYHGIRLRTWEET